MKKLNCINRKPGVSETYSYRGYQIDITRERESDCTTTTYNGVDPLGRVVYFEKCKSLSDCKEIIDAIEGD